MEGIGTMAMVGGFLLAIVLVWAVISNRRSRGAVRHTEEATKDLYARVDRQDQATDPDPEKY